MAGAKADYVAMSTSYGKKELTGYSLEQTDKWDSKTKIKEGKKYIKIVQGCEGDEKTSNSSALTAFFQLPTRPSQFLGAGEKFFETKGVLTYKVKSLICYYRGSPHFVISQFVITVIS